MLKPYPVGRQDFEAVITEGYKYIDKTQRMWEMMQHRHMVFLSYVLFTWLGFYNQAEVYTAAGRIDILLHSDAHIFIMELKVDESAQIALNQINSLHYADKYVSSGKGIVKIGVNFSSQTRTVEDWIIER